MSAGNLIKLSLAESIAFLVADELSPFCDRLSIAGSIRRRRDWVNDVDIVCIPKDRAGLLARIKRNCQIVTDAEQKIVARLRNGVPLDIWLAHGEKRDLLSLTPSNFGTLLTCRTGSVAHNIWLVEHAKMIGLRWHPHQGVYDPKKLGDNLIASAEEADVFAALGLGFVPPEARER